MAQKDHSEPESAPLISNRTALIGLALLFLMGTATAVITFGGSWLGPRLAIGGHTTSMENILVRIGQDELQLPANTIRFREQRHSGTTDRLDLYLTWPEMSGYLPELRNRFDDTSGNDRLIFLQISQSTMSRDMSGRLEPIYTHLFEGHPDPGPYGLLIHHLRKDSGYGDDVILTAPEKDGYVVRCLLPSMVKTAAERPTSADCQRDIRAGQDLTILYRFSSALLPEWKNIDDAISRFIQARVKTSQNGSKNR